MTSHYLRPAAARDASIIAAWFATPQDARLWGGPAIPDPLTGPWLSDQFAGAPLTHYVLTDGLDRVCGLCALVRKGDAVHLARVAIAPERRGNGLGKILMRHAIAMAASTGAREMTLYVYEGNAGAMRLYAACGFAQIRRVPRAETGGDMLMLALDLRRHAAPANPASPPQRRG